MGSGNDKRSRRWDMAVGVRLIAAFRGLNLGRFGFVVVVLESVMGLLCCASFSGILMLLSSIFELVEMSL